ncbi:MAG: TrkA family potassium uptake protein [Elusimicrobiota bacterium]|nr:TrkA family potassium uptake protein [Endomicrobiia bacterium]MCX7910072.1 TrkA family potassium uptake protein [Endomicrobiia bacterium]MDW8165959.1 TrkA family potassium uptake protein [Elusimicrobiota bacterium]
MAASYKPKTFVVIGLGVFGSYVVKYLSKYNVDIIGIDKDEKKVDEVKEYLKVPIVGDATDIKQLEDAGISPKDVDVIIVAVGESIEENLYITLLLKELEIKKIVARALNTQHAKILAKIGVDKIVFPEAMAAENLINSLLSPSILEHFNLSEEHSIVEVIARKEFFNKTIRELGLRTKYNVTVLGIRRRTTIINEEGEADFKDEILFLPSPEEEILQGDILIIGGKNSDIEKFKKE